MIDDKKLADMLREISNKLDARQRKDEEIVTLVKETVNLGEFIVELTRRVEILELRLDIEEPK